MTTTTISDFRVRAGEELGVSDYHLVTQDAVDQFAEATGDHQCIHTDPERARSGPFGGTIAHGYYTLSLAPALLTEVLSLDQFGMAVNYGLDKLRFPAPLRVGDRVRMRVALDAVDDIPGGSTLSLALTFEPESGGKPVCAGNVLYRVFKEAP